MARIHVLEQTNPGGPYRIIVHDTTPAGNNSVGVSWADAIKNAGLATTSMTEGVGAGQITTAEKVSIEAGTTIEAEFVFGIDPALSNAARNAALDAEANKLIAETQAKLAAKLKYFGATRN